MSENTPRPFRVEVEVTKAADGTGFGSTQQLPKLGRTGRIDFIAWRADPSQEDVTEFGVYITDEGADITARPAEEKRVYAKQTVTIAADATEGGHESIIADYGPAVYNAATQGDVRINFEVETDNGGGVGIGTKMVFLLTGEVYS